MIATIALALASVARPNIVLFIVDDLGWSDTSVPMDGNLNPLNRRYRTPNLTALAKTGTVYKNAYAAAPVCTPSRTAVMTGKSPAKTHVTYWTLDGDTSAKDPVIDQPKWQWQGLQPKDGPFLPARLKAAGYHTVHVGKAHFGALGNFAADPKAIGFDVNIAGHAAGAPGSFFGTHRFKNANVRGTTESSVWDVPGLEPYHDQDVFLEEALALEAQKAIREAKKTGKPLFLHFACYAVHAPIMANHRYTDNYQGIDQTERAYATMVASSDAALGSVIDELKVQGMWHNTRLVFTSDNGGLSAHARGGPPNTHNAPLKSGKGSFYEGGVRVPLVVHTPGQSPRHESGPIIGTDLNSLIASWAGVPGAKPQKNPVYWHQPHFWGATGPGIEPFSAVRSGRFKLVYKHRSQSFELYDLEDDPSETTDLSPNNPKLVKTLADRLTGLLTNDRDQMPTVRSTGKQVPWPSEAAKAL